MTVTKVAQASRIITVRPDLASFLGPVSEESIETAEGRLGIRFPSSYRAFLVRFGAGAFGATEIFGVIPSPANVGPPDAVWLTMQGRTDWQLPTSMVVVWFDGMGGYGVLDASRQGPDGEPPLHRWEPGSSTPDSPLEKLAPDFGSFFLERVEAEAAQDRDRQ
jgi:antitoxin YobK